MPPKVHGRTVRYRIAAFVVGVGLLILCLAMVLKYVFDQTWAVATWGPIHGILYIAYVLLAFDLAYKDRWSAKGTVLVLLAGVIPVVSFYAEHVVRRKVLGAREGLSRTARRLFVDDGDGDVDVAAGGVGVRHTLWAVSASCCATS